jgi:nicotinamide phosphoribosyltransferase
LTSYLETALLRAVWYPTTVATVSAHARSIIKKYLDLTSENPEEELPFKLHDFGARGVSSPESASIGGAAHLAAGAMGSDTIEGVIAASRFYNAPVSAFSIPASEHSTITSWMRSGESDAYENMVMQFSGEGRIYACVSDSYDIFEAIDMWAEKRDLIESKGGTLVIRPDSGDPVETPVSCVVRLAELFGTYKNSKGFLVLNDSVRVIQGDGITASSISEILEKLYDLGFSASNIAFGMGGGLLQHCDRDTLKFAMKCSAAEVDGVWRDVYKDPITDKGKKSKKGIISLFVNPDNEYRTLRVEEANYVTLGEPYVNCLNTVYKNGILTLDFDLEQVRSNSSNF